MEGIYGWIDEAIPALKARHLRWVLGRHDFFESSWPSVAHGCLTFRLYRMFRVGHLAQSSSASCFTAGASGFLNLVQSGERPESGRRRVQRVDRIDDAHGGLPNDTVLTRSGLVILTPIGGVNGVHGLRKRGPMDYPTALRCRTGNERVVQFPLRPHA
jgi:hypothetical protein